MKKIEGNIITVGQIERVMEHLGMSWMQVPSKMEIKGARMWGGKTKLYVWKDYEPVMGAQAVVLANLMHDLKYDRIELVSVEEGLAVLKGYRKPLKKEESTRKNV